MRSGGSPFSSDPQNWHSIHRHKQSTDFVILSKRRHPYTPIVKRPRRTWETAAYIATVVMGVLALVAFMKDSWPFTNSEAALRESVAGVWFEANPPAPDPRQPATMIRTSDRYSFNQGGNLTADLTIVAKYSGPGEKWELTCSGLAVGQWAVNGRKLTVKYGSVKVWIEHAVLESQPMSAEQAKGRGFHCPDTSFLPEGLSIEGTVVEIDQNRMRLEEIGRNGEKSTSLYTRQPQPLK